ncbi:hypothetical protein SAMN05216169_103216 [Anoxybacillus pushchinoensis]|uniref:Uncharacterized protein n=1 Tax=Anoxybacillus pushchinoensis TaxID=150248 RepID=A0A1I0TKN5_9BACL|nr:hypothetical protein [Anoxybacillus pushchinoensis]SFA52329.1 hypothetical protein SAMN05216169_103216 [Anoxybacillus pushchinoensis]
MAEIHTNGYVSIREHIVANWKKIVLLNASNAQVFTTNIDGTKARWAHTKGTQQIKIGKTPWGEEIFETVEIESNRVLEISLTVSGADVSLSSTVTKIQVLDTKNRIMTEETFTPFTFETAQDELTLSIKIQVPQQ